LLPEKNEWIKWANGSGSPGKNLMSNMLRELNMYLGTLENEMKLEDEDMLKDTLGDDYYENQK
jgi:hypothetical protein